MNKDEWMNVEQVAGELGVHVETIRKWIREKQLNAVSLGRRGGYRIRRSTLEDFMRRRETMPNQDER